MVSPSVDILKYLSKDVKRKEGEQATVDKVRGAFYLILSFHKLRLKILDPIP